MRNDPEYHQKYREANRTKIREYMREYNRINSDRIRGSKAKHRTDDPATALWIAAKQRAKNKGVPFNITPEDIVVPEVCPALGIPIGINRGVTGPNHDSMSLDRINPALGYVVGNIAVISNLANRIKQNATAQQVQAVADWMQKVEAHDSPDSAN